MPPVRISLSQVLSALSHALDLTEGQSPGHTLRSCMIGMRLANDIGLSADDRSALYYALLLKDAGCSSNAARLSALFASDDRIVKPGMKLEDWHHRLRLAFTTARHTGIGLPLAARVSQFLAIARTPDMTRDLIQVRCERGADIARRLGFPDATAAAIRSLDEHWVGLGHPDGRRETDIPILARILLLAQTLEVFHSARGVRAAMSVAARRRGTWFDPALVDAVAAWRHDDAWWDSLRDSNIAAAVVALEPGDLLRWVDDHGLDQIAQAFADIIDAKSPYTFRHSTRVAAFAVSIARQVGLDAVAERRLSRAGLLHDIGKLGVSNRILDKPGPLTPDERRDLERHPLHTFEILSRVAAFAEFAWDAAVHHEKLDGSGYPWGIDAGRLGPPARILAVADIYEALTADRPYRPALTPAAALDILHTDVAATRVWRTAVDALAAAIDEPMAASA